MSHRPTRVKQANRMRKRLRRRPLARYMNLVEWLRDRGHAQTAGAARKMLTEGRVKSESHIVGRREQEYRKPGHDETFVEFIAEPIVSAKLRSTLRVVPA